MATIRFTNMTNGKSDIVDIDNLSKKYINSLLNGKMSLQRFVIYMENQNKLVGYTLDGIDVGNYDELEIEIVNQ